MTSTFDRIRDLPCWSGRVTIEPLKGGLSNESFLVTEPAGRFVVRFGKDFPFHHVSREREVMVARAAFEAGFGPEVLHAEPGAMVTQYLGALTYRSEDVRRNAGRLADFMRRFHQVMPLHVSGPGYLFWVFHVIRDYARMIEHAESRHVADLPAHLAMAADFEAAQVPLPIVFGHNDLLPANVLDDGSRLWLIDYEYAGFNTALFDLAGLASNAGMDEAEAADMVARYVGPDRPPGLERAFLAMQAASLLREAMWSMVSELHLAATGIDYAAYTADNLDRLGTAVERFRQSPSTC